MTIPGAAAALPLANIRLDLDGLKIGGGGGLTMTRRGAPHALRL